MDPLQENIFLFIPNLIGYSRIILAIVSFYYMPTDYVAASISYLLSGFLDAFDGYAARALNQSTKFGAILDQITDRCALLALLTVLSHFYPKYMFYFQLSMIVDISSHWIHIWVSMMKGKASHKFMDPSANFILKWYYTSKPVLFTFCAANEIFYAGLYLLHFTEGPIGRFTLIITCRNLPLEQFMVQDCSVFLYWYRLLYRLLKQSLASFNWWLRVSMLALLT